ILLEGFEDGYAVHLYHGRLSGADAMLEIRPAADVPFSAGHDGEGAEAWAGIGAQDRGEGRLREFSVGAFREDSDTGGGAHEAVEGVRVGADLLGEFVGGFGGRFDGVGGAGESEGRDWAGEGGASHELGKAGVG